MQVVEEAVDKTVVVAGVQEAALMVGVEMELLTLVVAEEEVSQEMHCLVEMVALE